MELWLIFILLAVVFLIAGLRFSQTSFMKGQPSGVHRSQPQHSPPPYSGDETVCAAPSSEVDILPPSAAVSDPGVALDVFREDRAHRDVQKLANSQGLISQALTLRKQKWQREKEIELVSQWTEFFDAGGR